MTAQPDAPGGTSPEPVPEEIPKAHRLACQLTGRTWLRLSDDEYRAIIRASSPAGEPGRAEPSDAAIEAYLNAHAADLSDAGAEGIPFGQGHSGDVRTRQFQLIRRWLAAAYAVDRRPLDRGIRDALSDEEIEGIANAEVAHYLNMVRLGDLTASKPLIQAIAQALAADVPPSLGAIERLRAALAREPGA